MYLSEDWERTETERNVARVLEEVATEVGAKSIQAGTWCHVANRLFRRTGLTPAQSRSRT